MARAIMSQTIGQDHLAKKCEPYRFFNILVWALGVYLLWPVLRHSSSQPFLWSYSLSYLAAIACLAVLLLAWLLVLLKLSRSGQQFLLFTTVSVFAGLECLFHLDAVQQRFTAMHHFRETAPYLAFTGTRDRFDPQAAKSGEYRIFMLGGSTVNTGNPGLPKALEEIFHSKGRPEVRVYNYGVVSFISRQEMLLLLLEVLKNKPDMVIVYDGGNNIYQPYFGDPRPGYPYNWSTFEAGYALATDTAGFRRNVSWFLRKSAMLRSLLDDAVFQEDMLGIRELRAQSGYGTPAWRQALVENWRSSWEGMIRLAGADKVEIACLLQPFITEKSAMADAEKVIDGRYDEAFRQHMRESYEHMRGAIRDMADVSPGAVVRDLSHALDDYHGAAFTDVIHVSDDANRHLAGKIFEAVAPLAMKEQNAAGPQGPKAEEESVK